MLDNSPVSQDTLGLADSRASNTPSPSLFGGLQKDNMKFKVESNVPLVSNRGGRGRKPTAFPFDDMDVGDSFLIPCAAQDKKVLDSWRRKLRIAKLRYNESHEGSPIELRTAVVAEGLRVWMTA